MKFVRAQRHTEPEAAPANDAEMPTAVAALVRKLVVAFPFGCLTALASHQVRFGDDHAFGGDANEAIVSAAIGGSIMIAVLIVHTLLTAGSTTVTGTIARSRARLVLPGAPLIFALGGCLYYGIETLEGHGIELGVPTLVLAAIAAFVAVALRGLCAELARFVDTLARELVERLSARPFRLALGAPQPHPLRAQTLLTARRFGRAPPNERRFF